MQENNNFAFKEYLLKELSQTKVSKQEKNIEQCLNLFEFKLIKKNDYLVRQNEICNIFCFIESGILQHSIDILGEEKTSYLALKNSVTSSLKSFLMEIPSRKNIKAITDTKIWFINLNDFKKLLLENSVFHDFYFSLIEKQICLIDDYRIDLLTLSPEERYKKLLSTEPNLLQEVPLHYLASFLGISSRHMSRIRKNIL